MAGQQTPEYLLANPHDIESLANKLAQFAQTLPSTEQALFMERIKRSMPAADTGDTPTPIPSAEVFGAWLNSIVPDGLRWFPETVV
jgi:hypothetical protein